MVSCSLTEDDSCHPATVHMVDMTYPHEPGTGCSPPVERSCKDLEESNESLRDPKSFPFNMKSQNRNHREKKAEVTNLIQLPSSQPGHPPLILQVLDVRLVALDVVLIPSPWNVTKKSTSFPITLKVLAVTLQH